MTRFARAHGSKSSNERLPEAATSWNVMKQQLVDKLQPTEALAGSATSSLKIWKSSDFDRDVWNKNEVKWADLEDSECADKAVKSGEQYNKLEKKNKKRKHNKTIPNELFSPTTGENQKKRKKKDIDSGEFHDTQSTGIELAMSDDNLRHANNAGKTKSKKMKKGTNDEMNDTSGIKLEKQTVIATDNTEHKVCSTNKQKTKQQKMTDLAMYEMSEDRVFEENREISDFTKENKTKMKLGKKRKRRHDCVSSTQDKQPAIKYGSELKIKEKANLKKSVASEASDHQLKKKHKHSKNENTFEDSGCLNSVKQNFPEEDTETAPGAVADVVPSEKHRKKKKSKDNKNSKAVEGADTSLSSGKLNFQFEGNGTHRTVTSNFKQKEGRETRKKDVWRQENNKKFMKKRQFSAEDRKIKNRKSENKYLHTTILHMNGTDIEIVKFDGFPVKKEDAENLIQLKKKMIANRIPASEIKATMKLERRKAEKALAREKKKVCFHCRNSGHVLSECPELGNADTEDIGTGICFKCGSTEHKHFECRVTREQEFRYAKCFICNEQGHIARQCPDNPRGLYPKGGACHVCGDVTHLKKDCPDLIKEKEEKVIKLQTLSNEALEALEDDKSIKSAPPNHVNKKRTVKF